MTACELNNELDVNLPSGVFALSGLPRSGTTYLAAVLHDPPSTITMSEARGAWKQAWRNGANTEVIAELMHEFHERIRVGEAVATFEGTPGYSGDARVDTWNQPKIERAIDTTPGFRLGFKNPEVFLDWLPQLRELGIPVVITVRHPVTIVNSWLKKRTMRITRGKDPAGHFGNGDATTFTASASDPIDRCIELHEYLATKIVKLLDDPGVLIIRYEHWFSDDNLLTQIVDFLGLHSSKGLSPRPIRPETPNLLDDDAIERLRTGCLSAEPLGYSRNSEAWRAGFVL